MPSSGRRERTRRARLAALVLALVAASLTLLAGAPGALAQVPALSIDDVIVDPEGNTGTKTATFTISLSAPSATDVTVSYATANGTAVAPTDYVAVAPTQTTIPANTTAKTVTVTVNGDAADEVDETFEVILSAPNGATIGDPTGSGTIVDDDAPPALSVSDPTGTEGGTVQFTVTLAPASGKTVTVAYATMDGTAISMGMGTDFTPANGTLTFDPGQTTKTVSVATTADAVDELNETFSLQLSDATNATIADAAGTGTITDDDGPTISIDDVTIDPEGNTGTKTATFTISLSATSIAPVTVSYATANDTAVGTGATPDFTPVAATPVTFTAGETTKTVAITVNGDTTDEIDETFRVNLSAASGGTIGDQFGVGTIVDDDAPPTLSVNDPSIAEGTGGTRTLVFTVTLSAASGKTVTVDYVTIDGTASSTGASDFTAVPSGTPALSFSPGMTTRTVSVTITTDSVDEPDETLTLQLSNATNATIADATGTGTIVDDDGPHLAVNDITVTEGNGGTTAATFTVRLITSSSNSTPLTTAQTVTAKVETVTVSNSATAPADFTALASATTTVTIPANQPSATVTVNVVGDLLDEPDELFRLRLTSPVGATVSDSNVVANTTDSVGQATIVDDDPLPSLSIADASIDEGSIGAVNVVLTVTLSAPSGRTILATYNSADGTAKEGVDYAEATGTLTFIAGETSKTITIPIGADQLVENDEVFTVRLTPAGSNVTLGHAVATVTIVDDDLTASTTPSLSVADASADEGDSGTTPMKFTVRVAPALGRSVAVSYQTSDRSAIAPADYDASSGRIQFEAGETEKTIEIAVRGDVEVEGSQSFTLTLSEPANAVIGDATATGAIRENDIGLGPITVPASQRATGLLCATRRRCPGLTVGWTVYARGRLSFDLAAVVQRRRKGSKTVRGTRLVPLLKTSSTINVPRTGRKVLRPTPGSRARRTLTRLRRDRATALRLKVTFTNRSGTGRTVVKTVRLRLR